MRKIISGRSYDTETAEKKADWWNGLSMSDFSYVREWLYRKKNGEFFLHGEGGPASRYAKAVDKNSWEKGEKIIPLTYEEAQQWAEGHLNAAEYEAIFGPVPEDSSTITISIRTTADAAEIARRAAAAAGMGLGEYISRLIKADGGSRRKEGIL